MVKTAPPSLVGRVSIECSLKGPTPSSGEKTLRTKRMGEVHQVEN